MAIYDGPGGPGFNSEALAWLLSRNPSLIKSHFEAILTPNTYVAMDQVYTKTEKIKLFLGIKFKPYYMHSAVMYVSKWKWFAYFPISLMNKEKVA